MRDISLKGVSVLIGMPAHRAIPVPTAVSLANTIAACINYRIPMELCLTNGSSVVMTARNQVAATFLRGDWTHLFFIDSDIQWRVEQFLRVLAMATQHDTARAVYPRRQDVPVFDRDGLGFACIQRRVMQALADDTFTIYFGEQEPAPAIFRESFVKSELATNMGADLEYFAEDATFFAEIERRGFTSWIDPLSSLGHVGEKIYRANVQDTLWEVDDGTADRMREEAGQEGDTRREEGMGRTGDAGHQPGSQA